MSELALQRLPQKRQRTAVDIAQHLVQSMVLLDTRPGDKLPPERRMVEMLGVSRSPLREALKCLDILGFIEIRQGDGTYRSTRDASALPKVISWGLLLGSQEVKDLIDARYYTETALAELAAQRRTADDVMFFRSCLQEMQASNTPEEFAEADTQFHFAVAEAANNSTLSSMLESIRFLLDAWIVRVVSEALEKAPLIAEHQKIFDAIAGQNPQEARTAMGDHILSVTQRLRGTLESDNNNLAF